MRGKFSLAGAQSHGVIKAWEPNTTEQLTHKEGRPVSVRPTRTRKVSLKIVIDHIRLCCVML